jgi:hypothetical protein
MQVKPLEYGACDAIKLSLSLDGDVKVRYIDRGCDVIDAGLLKCLTN